MAVQKDYILRMTEMLAEMLAIIFGYIKSGKFALAEKAIENVYFSLLKEDAAYFHHLPDEELTSVLISKHHYTNAHIEVLAELFLAEAELNVGRQKHVEGLVFYQKAVKLFSFIETTDKVYSLDRSAKIEMITNRIKSLKSDSY